MTFNVQWVENIFEGAFTEIIVIDYKFVVFLWNYVVSMYFSGPPRYIFGRQILAKNQAMAALSLVVALMLIEQFNSYTMEFIILSLDYLFNTFLTWFHKPITA